MASTNFLVHLDMNGNEIQNVLAQNLSAVPTTNTGAGRFYFNTTDDTLYVKTANSGWLNALGQGQTYSEGSGIDITSNVISVDIATGANAGNVTLTTTNGLAASVAEASTSAKGIIEIATDTEASTGTSETLAVNPKQLATKVTANSAITGATKCKITYDSKGLVTGGADLSASDIPSLTLSKISDVTATTSEINVLDGITATTAELNYTDGVTSNIQTQLDNKLAKKPDGTNDLINSGNKVNLTYIPDVLTGQMLYAGTVVPSTAVATLSTNAKTKLGTTSDTITLTNDTTAITGYAANEGNYYICSADGTFAGVSLLTGDWLISTGSGWTKIDNTDAVTGVKGNAESTYRTGNINITADNVMPTQTGNSGKYLTTNGTTVSWGTVDALPSQTSQSGKFLTTNGTTASWASAVTPDGTQTLTNKTIDADDNTISDLTTSNFKSGTIVTSIGYTGSDTAVPTEKAVASALKIKADIHYDIHNPALTASGGEANWVISGAVDLGVSFSNRPCINVYVYEASTGNQVNVASNYSITGNDTFNLTISFNTTSNIAANTYVAMLICPSTITLIS